MTIACLLVPSLALACALADRSGRAERLALEPVALADGAGLRVADATPAALARGVRPGQTISEAASYCPALGVLEAHPARVARAVEALVEAMASVSPLVERAATEWPDTRVVYADLRGLEGLYPEPGMVERAVLERVGAASVGYDQDALPPAFRPRLGIAETRFTAFAAARDLAKDEADQARRIEAHEAAAFLAERPASWLPLDDEVRERLRLLGIDTVGAFAALPRHAVEAQFGLPGGQAWLAARGEDPTPVRPDPFAAERIVEQAQAEPPLVSRESVLRTVEQLLARSLRQPLEQGRFVRAVRLRATTEDDRLWERTQVMKEPTGDRKRLWTAIRPLLERAEYPGPIAGLELELGGLTAESARQGDLFVEHARRREQLDEMVRHLKARYGQSPVARMVEVEPWSRLPERRHALIDYDP